MLLRPKEVCKIFRVTNQTLVKWVKKGYLKAVTTPKDRIGVYDDEVTPNITRRMYEEEEVRRWYKEKFGVDYGI